jgi:hypothetical protein
MLLLLIQYLALIWTYPFLVVKDANYYKKSNGPWLEEVGQYPFLDTTTEFKILNIKHVSEIRKFDMLLLYKSQLVAVHKIREYIILFHNRRTTTL